MRIKWDDRCKSNILYFVKQYTVLIFVRHSTCLLGAYVVNYKEWIVYNRRKQMLLQKWNLYAVKAQRNISFHFIACLIQRKISGILLGACKIYQDHYFRSRYPGIGLNIKSSVPWMGYKFGFKLLATNTNREICFSA